MLRLTSRPVVVHHQSSGHHPSQIGSVVQWSKSIYFKDPNCLSLEYCCAARSRTEEEAMPAPFTASHARRTGSDACFDQSQQHTQ
jgi:hypothetical protein